MTQRFDRRVLAPGRVARLHQEDFCQGLGLDRRDAEARGNGSGPVARLAGRTETGAVLAPGPSHRLANRRNRDRSRTRPAAADRRPCATTHWTGRMGRRRFRASRHRCIRSRRLHPQSPRTSAPVTGRQRRPAARRRSGRASAASRRCADRSARSHVSARLVARSPSRRETLWNGSGAALPRLPFTAPGAASSAPRTIR